MTPENLIKELERYRNELIEIMKRFIRTEGIHGSISMNSEDDPRFRTFVIEIIDLLNDTIPGNRYSTIIQNTYNGGYRAFFCQYSYKCVEDIVATLDSIITRIKRNPELCNSKKDVTLINKPIEYPNKITIQWLKLYVPHHFWFWLASLLFAAFILGVSFGQSTLYHDLTTKTENPTILKTHVTVTTENTDAKNAAPIKSDALKK